MPLEKGAKPGSKGFGRNIAAELKSGKPLKQAQAIAYSESGETHDFGNGVKVSLHDHSTKRKNRTVDLGRVKVTVHK